MYQKNNIKDFFFQAFNVDAEKMVVNKPLDVSNNNVFVKSFNIKLNVIEPQRVLKIIRKRDSREYVVHSTSGNFSCSKDHRILMKFELDKKEAYMKVRDILKSKQKEFFVLNKSLQYEKAQITKNDNLIKIFDFEVENNHNYFSNNMVSHNTVYGPHETTTGGNALKFYASIRCDIRRIEIIKDKDSLPVSNRVRVKVVKNKTYSPFKECNFIINYGMGISSVDEIADLAIEFEIIKKAGSWFSYGDTKLGQGRENLIKILGDNIELFEEIEKKTLLCINQ